MSLVNSEPKYIRKILCLFLWILLAFWEANDDDQGPDAQTQLFLYISAGLSIIALTLFALLFNYSDFATEISPWLIIAGGIASYLATGIAAHYDFKDTWGNSFLR